ncbi:DegT/DnrJ/EryC1/StrS family aminotransferase [Salinarimonas sp. NSM]|uniref:DegT/DnrJ/EryC1/StrS family aminotransferase n=1 Tax=Salinarimonas sp. NSM TaxID=3458003 RepID=UPI0040368AE7
MDEKPTPIRFDLNDAAQVVAALAGQELWPYSRGGSPARNLWEEARAALERGFGASPHDPLWAVPASSGTAAIHVALGGLRIPAGSEVVVPPITDMGTVMPVIFQNAIPVFADVDRHTGLMTAQTIAAALTERTSAVVVVHLAGSAADMDPILALCRARGVKVIEDAAQGLGATYRGRPLGTLGDAGCFSLNAQKHITCGEGGFVLVRSREEYERCLSFSDKHRNRTGYVGEDGEHASYAGSGLNYRLSDLELAMILSQLPKLRAVAAGYTAVGRHLDARLAAIPGVAPQRHHPQAVPTYFFQMFRLEEAALARKAAVFAAMREAASDVGMSAWGPYVPEPLYRSRVFAEKRFFPVAAGGEGSAWIWPAELVAHHLHPDLPEGHYDYAAAACPEAEAWIESSLGLRFHDRHTVAHADHVADAIVAALDGAG